MKPVFFMWIPKCGGGSLHNAIKRNAQNQHIGASWTQTGGQFDIPQDCDYYVGHWPASVLDRLPETINITMLRDPVQRVISHYNYVHEHGYWYDDDYTKFAKGATFEEWMRSVWAYTATHNFITRFFCDRDITNLDMALMNMEKFNIIGILDEKDDSIETAYKVLRVVADMPEPFEKSHHNSSQKTVTIDDLSLDTREELQYINQKDMLLFQGVKHTKLRIT